MQLKRMRQQREKFLAEVYPFFANQLITGDKLLDLCRRTVTYVFPAIHVNTLFDSLRNLVGVTLTPARAAEAAWRVAGNSQRLASGSPVPVWCGTGVEEWVPAEVTRVVPSRRSYRAVREKDVAVALNGVVYKNGVHLDLLILGGFPAGKVVTTFWSTDQCLVNKVLFGFSRFNRARYSRVVSRRREFPFQDAREFFGLLCYVKIDPKLCFLPDRVGFSEVKSTPALVKQNRDLMLARERDEVECPFGWAPSDVPCFDCPVGTDCCDRACHDRTYAEKFCADCDNTTYHDDGGDGECVVCRERQERPL